MLVRLIHDKNNNNWQVICLTGAFYEQQIATAEGVRLSSARFQAHSVTGHIAALYGAEIRDEVLEDGAISRSMGIGGVFKPCHHQAIHDEWNTGWFDATTREPVKHVSHITVMGDEVHYSTDLDIAADRKGYTVTAPRYVAAPTSDANIAAEALATRAAPAVHVGPSNLIRKIKNWIGR